MIKKISILVALCHALIFGAFSQSFHLDFLFSPGVIVGADYLAPSALNDSTDFEMVKYKFRYIQPLRTKMGIDLKGFDFKKMDAKASQIFLDYYGSVTQPKMNADNGLENIYKIGVGLTAITASVRHGIWLYSGTVYADENKNTFSDGFTPNFRAYVANLKIKDLNTYYFYGAGVLLNQGKVVPFPVLGLKSKIAKNLKAEIVIPLHVKLNYSFSKDWDFDLVNQFAGVNTIYRDGSGFSSDSNNLNFSQMKAFVALNGKLGKHYKIKLEGGYSYLQKISTWRTGDRQDLDPAPYAGVTLNYHFGKSVFRNFLNREE
ncbi:MAG: hypothetical protein KDD41_00495 [Flavobacteriales bacterium]|nr:hypothetical protein [Flavobacteriales bacterium]